ncbi:MAG: D-glycero-beta-D-manno-heptose 1-phosphate adenylyltransferase [Chlorobi bacterium]|nr:D-glycero-beta-D-manno-heptose 1-phosphate adenylyltransferase [Chlorobiota bacterium]
MGKVVTWDDLKELREGWKRERKIVVFTNGVFDILHRGHCEYLERARAQGDVLVVGLNADDSVRRIKGEKKPIVPEEDRAFILTRLRSVDVVCLFHEDTPERLIANVLPDVLVKGADYKPAEIVGRETVERNGGKVVTIPLTPNKSSTGIIETILERYCAEGAKRYTT